MNRPLVEAAWLAAHLDDDDVLVVDCRFVLGDPGGGRRLFDQSRIPGASFLDVDGELAAPVATPGALGPIGGRHPLPARADLELALRRAGVGSQTHVVAYDQSMTGGAARLWWLLRHHRFERCSVLRGGLAEWAGALEHGARHITPVGDVVLTEGRDDDVVGADEIALGAVTVLDARAPERFVGDVEPVDPVAGHIPGAENVPFAGAFALDDQLLERPGPLAASCGSGVTACVLLLGLAEAGRDDVRLYPGSWSDWVARGGEVETGADGVRS